MKQKFVTVVVQRFVAVVVAAVIAVGLLGNWPTDKGPETVVKVVVWLIFGP